MELSKQEMELFLLFPDLRLKNFFYRMFPTFNNEFKNFFWSKIFQPPKFFNPNFFWSKFFLTPNIFRPKKKILHPKIFSTQKNFPPRFFDPKIFRANFFLDKKIFRQKKIFGPRKIFNKKIFNTKKKFKTKNF